MFDRGARVLLAGDEPARVLFDDGATLVVRTGATPSTARRVARENVRPDEGKRDLLYCVETGRGLCVLQRQADPPGAKEMAEGQWTLCGLWVQTRSKPTKLKSDCTECLGLLL